jgi:hypothetical protein
MKKFLLSLVMLLGLSSPAFSLVDTFGPGNCTFFSSVAASSDRTVKVSNLLRFKNVEFHLHWASLTGTLNGAWEVQISDDPACAVGWLTKAGTAGPVDIANGDDIVSLPGTGTSNCYQVVFTHGGITGGTVSGWCVAKE